VSNIALLDERIQRWVWSRGWTSLKDAQEEAIPILLDAQRDVIISAATASGKTEAAFLPILTKLKRHGEQMGVALYISPLKALINDQWGRLEQLCDELGVPVTPWHGDISAPRKRRFMKRPQGVLLMTPESLEALFVLRGHELRRFFAKLEYIVVDELHVFIGSDRGKQMQSLMHRIETVIERRVPRVGLSATLGDMESAGMFLRGAGPAASIIQSKTGGQELKLQLRGYTITAISGGEATDHPDPGESLAHARIADHLFQVLHGANNLLFPNSRSNVEYYSDLLRRRCEAEGIPNEFWPHHGSLSREIREDTEARLKAGGRPATAVCTTTLELGIDLGEVKSVAQIGPPPSVAALRQRLGRSGRRPGEPTILRAYVAENEITTASSVSDRLREGLLLTAASIRLLLQGWFEPPQAGGLHLSTLVQQILSMIAERGGVSAVEISRTLIRDGPFEGLKSAQLITLLRGLGQQDLVAQESSGSLLLGGKGERMVASHDFYAAFASGEEWKIIHDGRALGTLPMSSPVFEGMCIIFGGRRWRILSVCSEPPVLTVTADASGRAPKFDSGRAMVHERVRLEMRKILEETQELEFLDDAAQDMLRQARHFYRDARLDDRMVVMSGDAVLLVPWAGDLAQNALVLMLRLLGLEAGANEGLIVRCPGWNLDRIKAACSEVLSLPETDFLAMLKDVENLRQSKWDWALPRDLLVQSYASTHLDIEGAKRIAAAVVAD